jgi:hypothetical protein
MLALLCGNRCPMPACSSGAFRGGWRWAGVLGVGGGGWGRYVTEVTEQVDPGLPEALATCAYTEQVRWYPPGATHVCIMRQLWSCCAGVEGDPPFLTCGPLHAPQIIADTDVEIAAAIERGDTASVGVLCSPGCGWLTTWQHSV